MKMAFTKDEQTFVFTFSRKEFALVLKLMGYIVFDPESIEKATAVCEKLDGFIESDKTPTLTLVKKE